MGVNESRDDVAAAGVENLAALVRAQPRDEPVDDREFSLEPLPREGAERRDRPE